MRPMQRLVLAVVALAGVVGIPTTGRAQTAAETRDSLTGIRAVGVSVRMPTSAAIQPVWVQTRAKLQAGGIQLADAPAGLRISGQVVKSDSPGVAAFLVEVELTQAVDVRANGRRLLVPTWSRRELGVADESRVIADIQTTAMALLDEFVKAWQYANPR